jgi:hypothetical protein
VRKQVGHANEIHRFSESILQLRQANGIFFGVDAIFGPEELHGIAKPLHPSPQPVSFGKVPKLGHSPKTLIGLPMGNTYRV